MKHQFVFQLFNYFTPIITIINIKNYCGVEFHVKVQEVHLDEIFELEAKVPWKVDCFFGLVLYDPVLYGLLGLFVRVFRLVWGIIFFEDSLAGVFDGGLHLGLKRSCKSSKFQVRIVIKL